MQFTRSSCAAALLAMGILGGCGVPQDGSSSPQADAISVAQANALASKQASDTALARVKRKAGAGLKVSMHKSTDMARFLRVPAGSSASLGNGPAKTAAQQASESAAFFRDFGPAVGVSNPASMRLQSTKTDGLGHTHLTYRQYHGDVPVFGAMLKTHFDKTGRMNEVAGTAIPDISVSTTPKLSRDQAGAVARAAVVADRGDSDLLRVGGATLYVFREGLAQGIPNGENHLAWEVEVTDGGGVRDLVYVDAHSGKMIDRINMVQDAMFRRAYDGKNLPRVPDNYPNGAYWLEGDRFPTNSQEANNMIIASKETYDYFFNNYGRDSFDGKGAKMDAIFDRGYSCPNASWNGTFISFCPGLTNDDVTAHEWGHAYTQYTHDLIYQWQPGALNEAYSDIWGETVDQSNGRGGDSPGGARAAGACSTFSPPVGTLRVNAPAAIAADYFAQSALFGPPLSTTGITGEVVAALDGANASGPSTTDGCTSITNGAQVAGKIAIIDRGTCEFSTKVLNAQIAGAVAVIIANNSPTGLPGMGPGAVAAQVTIPSLGVQQSTGIAIRAQLTALVTVNTTLLARPGTDNSVLWLIGEDNVGGITGALRDMWNPACYSNPGRVGDTAFYFCGTADNGGVHLNSGVPNHGYALLVSGGTYNGQTVNAIGRTKAAHIYFRAQDTYQVQDSDFADHADALDASCADLIGSSFPAIGSDPLNGPINAGDCAQVANAIAAVELRAPTTFCNFPRLLNPGLPPLCSTTTTTGVTTPITSFDFESNPTDWSVSHETPSATFTPRDWTWVNTLPNISDGPPAVPKLGSGFFAPTPITDCADHDETGVLHLTSSVISIPPTASFARATFEQWMSTEAIWDGAVRLGVDGGNLRISVNGGAWQLVPASQFSFNGYTANLLTAADGNTNPLAGQPAWSGTNNGSVVDGSWGRTHVDLGNFAAPGDSVQLRWDLGTDLCSARAGWYLDNVNVFSCTPKIPSVSVADVSVLEGDPAHPTLDFIILLSTPTIVPVAVTVETVDGTAVHGNDYDRVAGTVVIPASSGGIRIQVPIKDDTVQEGNETFTFRITNVTNATIGDGEATGTILDDDTTPPPH
jgi:Zn-dependent metalloprotease